MNQQLTSQFSSIRLLATTSADCTVQIWRTADFSRMTELKENSQRWVWDCAFSSDSQYIITGKLTTIGAPIHYHLISLHLGWTLNRITININVICSWFQSFVKIHIITDRTGTQNWQSIQNLGALLIAEHHHLWSFSGAAANICLTHHGLMTPHGFSDLGLYQNLNHLYFDKFYNSKNFVTVSESSLHWQEMVQKCIS